MKKRKLREKLINWQLDDLIGGFPGGAVEKNLPAKAGYAGSILGLADPLEEEMATHSIILCLEKSMDTGAWQTTVHGASKSQMQLSTHVHTHALKEVT